jgi:NAD(P)-dependent dehydrogenase (short-subunit alcohol dehydrogenase family)
MSILKNNLDGKAVVITGGTDGIGRACGLLFARHGAHVYLTHRWGSADEDELRGAFTAVGAREPVIIEADASLDEDTEALMQRIKNDHDRVEAVISNVSFAHVSKSHDDLDKKSFLRSLGYSAWPFIGYLQAVHAAFGRYPRYAIGMSSRGPEYFLPGYDFVAASKVVMETFCRYLTADLLSEDIRINVVRANPVETRSLEATFGPEFAPFCKQYYGEGFFVAPEEVASAALGLCSGLMDAVKGQVLLLDRGFGFADNVVRLFSQREQHGLSVLTPQDRLVKENR